MLRRVAGSPMECVDIDIDRAVRQLRGAMHAAAPMRAFAPADGGRPRTPPPPPLSAEDAAAIDALERLHREPESADGGESYAYVEQLIDRVVAARASAPPAMQRLVDARAAAMADNAHVSARSIGYSMARTALDNLAILQSAQPQRHGTAFNETGQCPICYDDFGPTSTTTTTECCHKFCTDCWSRWESEGRSRVTCPLCGTVVGWPAHTPWSLSNASVVPLLGVGVVRLQVPRL